MTRIPKRINLSFASACDGRGNCLVTTYNNCVNNGGFYQGDSSSCFDTLGRSICSSGTGPCCINGTCSQTNFNDCFTANGFYGGFGQPCGLFDCPDEISCLGFVDGFPITPGSDYGGGVVVGTFIPGQSEILGASSLFSPLGVTAANKGYTFATSLYTSTVDHTAYGITKDCNFINEAYILIVYPHDIAIDNSKNIKNPETQSYVRNTFPWGGTGSAWGPLLDSSFNYSDLSSTYISDHLYYTEGFWSTGFTGITQAENINVFNGTFPSCSASIKKSTSGIDRAANKPIFALHGVWHQSWGLHNTVRAVRIYGRV